MEMLTARAVIGHSLLACDNKGFLEKRQHVVIFMSVCVCADLSSQFIQKSAIFPIDYTVSH